MECSQGSLRRSEAEEGTKACTIQRFFLNLCKKTRKRISDQFTKNVPRHDQGLSFPVLTALIKQEEVQKSANDFLKTMLRLCNINLKDGLHVEIYLAAYVIVEHPEKVFEGIGDTENNLLNAAKNVIWCFQKAADGFSDGKSWGDIKLVIGDHLQRYLLWFKKWNQAQNITILKRLQNVMTMMQEAKERLKVMNPNSPMLQELEQKSAEVEAKIKRMRGEVPENVPAAKRMTRAMSGKEVAHHLLIDQNFRLSEQREIGGISCKIVETIMERSYWDSLVENLLSNPPSYAPFLDVLREIVTSMEAHCITIHREAVESMRVIIDVEQIKRQLDEKTFLFSDCDSLIDKTIGVILSIQHCMMTFERKNETITKWKECREAMQAANEKNSEIDRARALCNALELVLERIHKTRFDFSNKKLSAIAPVVKHHGIKYEQLNFERELKEGNVTLERTQKWIHGTISQLEQQQNPIIGISELISEDSRAQSYKGVVQLSIVDLIIDWSTAVPPGEEHLRVPETMVLDLKYFQNFNVHFHSNVISSIILIRVDGILRSKGKDPLELRKSLENVNKIVKKHPPRPSNVQPVIDLVMEEISQHLIESETDLTKRLLEKDVVRGNEVYSHVEKIFRNVWFSTLYLPTMAQEFKIPKAAECMREITLKHVDQLSKVVAVNLVVHTKRYNVIINDILAQAAHSGRGGGMRLGGV